MRAVKNTADAVRKDITTEVASVLRRNVRSGDLVIVMRKQYAVNLSRLHNTFGQREFPDVTESGGDFCGMPVIIDDTMTKPVQVMTLAEHHFKRR